MRRDGQIEQKKEGRKALKKELVYSICSLHQSSLTSQSIDYLRRRNAFIGTPKMKVVKTCNDNNENLVLTNYNDSKDLDKLVCLGLIKMSCYNQEESANLIVRN